MKKTTKLLIALALLLCAFAVNAQDVFVVECGERNTINRDSVKVFSKLKFTCARILLVQDGSKVVIYNVEGVGSILRGGCAGAPTNAEGLDRFNGDSPPIVVLVGCASDFENLTIGENINLIEDYYDCEQ